MYPNATLGPLRAGPSLNFLGVRQKDRLTCTLAWTRIMGKLLVSGGLSFDYFVQYFYLVCYFGLSYFIVFSPVVLYNPRHALVVF